MNAELASKLLTLGVFGGIGWAVAQKCRLPVGRGVWLLLLTATLAGPFIGIHTNVICLNGVGICIRLNWVLVSCGLGILVGLLLRVRASRWRAA